MMTVLQALRDDLAAIDGVATCRIGLEANSTPADYPMIRVVPSRMGPAGVITRRRAEVLIYFGQPVHEFTDGMEALYGRLFELESAIIGVLDAGHPEYISFYQETFADEDRNEAYKLFAIRATLEG